MLVSLFLDVILSIYPLYVCFLTPVLLYGSVNHIDKVVQVNISMLLVNAAIPIDESYDECICSTIIDNPYLAPEQKTLNIELQSVLDSDCFVKSPTPNYTHLCPED